jgi:hypothetical protein
MAELGDTSYPFSYQPVAEVTDPLNFSDFFL